MKWCTHARTAPCAGHADVGRSADPREALGGNPVCGRREPALRSNELDEPGQPGRTDSGTPAEGVGSRGDCHRRRRRHRPLRHSGAPRRPAQLGRRRGPAGSRWSAGGLLRGRPAVPSRTRAGGPDRLNPCRRGHPNRSDVGDLCASSWDRTARSLRSDHVYEAAHTAPLPHEDGRWWDRLPLLGAQVPLGHRLMHTS